MKIPVQFDYKGKSYSGQFNQIGGAGGDVWYLMINGYYYGQLHLTDGEFFFTSQTGAMQDLSDFFGHVVLASYE